MRCPLSRSTSFISLYAERALDRLISFVIQIDQLNRPTETARMMRDIQASDAKTHLPQILDEVERGETVRITRHGRAVARIVPEASRRQEEIDRAIESIKALRRRTGKLTLDELLAFRHEGHKY